MCIRDRLPTVSDVPRTDNDGIVDYFTNFLKLEPQGEIQSGNIIVGTNWAQDAGIYEFTMGANNNAKVKGRYTFVYVYEDGEWKISQHHSSGKVISNRPYLDQYQILMKSFLLLLFYSNA